MSTHEALKPALESGFAGVCAPEGGLRGKAAEITRIDPAPATIADAEIDEDAWATLYRDTSRPFPRPGTGRVAVKVINHFGDEVMKVFRV